MPNDAFIEDEEDSANLLANERELGNIESGINDLRRTGLSYKHPSYFKYGILFTLAIVVDFVDLVDLTGAGAIVGRVVAGLFSVLMFFIFWFTNTRQKNADEYTKNVEAFVAVMEERLATLQYKVYKYSRRAMMASRIARRIPGLRGIARKVPRTMVKIRRIARKNPITRYLVMAGINEIPIISILPWQIIGVWLSYRAEKASYENARLAAESLTEEEEMLTQAA